MEDQEPPPPEAAEEEERRRAERAKYLLIAGAVTLLLPLLGIAFLKGTDPGLQPGFSGGKIFGQRGENDKPLTTPSMVPAAPLPVDSRGPKRKAAAPQAGGSSLGFVKGDGVHFTEPQAPKEEPKTAAEPEKPAPIEREPAARPKPEKKKGLSYPKLNPTSGGAGSFSDFRGKQSLGQKGRGEKGRRGQAALEDYEAEAAAPRDPEDVPDLLKSIPGLPKKN